MIRIVTTLVDDANNTKNNDNDIINGDSTDAVMGDDK